MKDAAHHLKHLQKKVIQSTRKAQAAEALLHESDHDNVAPAMETEVSHIHKKKQFANPNPSSMRRLHVH